MREKDSLRRRGAARPLIRRGGVSTRFWHLDSDMGKSLASHMYRPSHLPEQTSLVVDAQFKPSGPSLALGANEAVREFSTHAKGEGKG